MKCLPGQSICQIFAFYVEHGLEENLFKNEKK